MEQTMALKHLTEEVLVSKGFTKMKEKPVSNILDCRKRTVTEFEEDSSSTIKSIKHFTGLYIKTPHTVRHTNLEFHCFMRKYNDGINNVTEYIIPELTREGEDNGKYVVLIQNEEFKKDSIIIDEKGPAFYYKNFPFEYVYEITGEMVGKNWRDNVKTILINVEKEFYTHKVICNLPDLNPHINIDLYVEVAGFSYCADVAGLDLGDAAEYGAFYTKSSKDILKDLFSMGIHYHTEYKPEHIDKIDWFRASLIGQTEESLKAYKDYLDLDLVKIVTPELKDLIDSIIKKSQDGEQETNIFQ